MHRTEVKCLILHTYQRNPQSPTLQQHLKQLPRATAVLARTQARSQHPVLPGTQSPGSGRIEPAALILLAQQHSRDTMGMGQNTPHCTKQEALRASKLQVTSTWGAKLGDYWRARAPHPASHGSLRPLEPAEFMGQKARDGGAAPHCGMELHGQACPPTSVPVTSTQKLRGRARHPPHTGAEGPCCTGRRQPLHGPHDKWRREGLYPLCRLQAPLPGTKITGAISRKQSYWSKSWTCLGANPQELPCQELLRITAP